MKTGTIKVIGALLLLTPLICPDAVSYGQEEGTIFASRILDQDVYDDNQKLIGEVDDIVIRRSGKAKKLIVEYGGVLDIGDKLVSVSFKNFDRKEGGAYLKVSEQQLNKRPEFDPSQKGLFPDYYYRYRKMPYKNPYRYPPPMYYHYGAEHREPIDPSEWAFSPARLLVSSILYRHLINNEGRDVGRVRDFVIDLRNNQIEKIIISSKDILGPGVFAALDYDPMDLTPYGIVYDIEPKEVKDRIYPYKE